MSLICLFGYFAEKMHSARIFALSNVEELRNHSVTFSVSKTDFTCSCYDKVGLDITHVDKRLITK